MKTNNPKQEKRIRLKRKIRARISGTKEIPRLSVFKSNLHVYAQIIDDTIGNTIVSAHDKELKGTYRERAVIVGKSIAELATKAGISKVVFDRNGYKYTGHIKALADSARASGLTF